jgi:hypothetical protein
MAGDFPGGPHAQFKTVFGYMPLSRRFLQTSELASYLGRGLVSIQRSIIPVQAGYATKPKQRMRLAVS